MNYLNLLSNTDIVIIITYFILYVVSTLYFKNKDNDLTKQIFNIVKSLTLMILLIFVVRDYLFYDYKLDSNIKYLFKIFEILFVILLSINIYNIINLFIDLKIKTKKRSNTKIAWKFLLKISISIVSFVTILNLSGVGEKFGMTATISMVGVFLGLTSSVWFPSIKSGLVMLLSKTIQEEDTIEVPELNIYGVINSIGLFSTIIRNEIDNHRIVISNEKLEGSIINNISRPARVGGLRENLEFKIGYIKDSKQISTTEIREFFEKAFEKAKVNKYPITINFDKEPEIFLTNPGDYALEWKLFYYTDNVKNRIKDKYLLYEVFFRESKDHNISLSTPMLIEKN